MGEIERRDYDRSTHKGEEIDEADEAVLDQEGSHVDETTRCVAAVRTLQGGIRVKQFKASSVVKAHLTEAKLGSKDLSKYPIPLPIQNTSDGRALLLCPVTDSLLFAFGRSLRATPG